MYINLRKHTNIYKIQASVQHGLYLFTCKISSVNSRLLSSWYRILARANSFTHLEGLQLIL